MTSRKRGRHTYSGSIRVRSTVAAPFQAVWREGRITKAKRIVPLRISPLGILGSNYDLDQVSEYARADAS
jgi:hypothetical protein